jgi:hypothetical protein
VRPRPLTQRACCRRAACAHARTDEDFEKWCTQLFEALEAQPALLGAAAGGGDESLATYRVEVVAGGKAASPFPDGSGLNAHDPYWATVTEVRASLLLRARQRVIASGRHSGGTPAHAVE